MITTTCVMAWAAALLLVPLLIIYRISESQSQKIRRLRSSGWTQKRIAERLGITTYKVRRLLAAA